MMRYIRNIIIRVTLTVRVPNQVRPFYVHQIAL